MANQAIDDSFFKAGTSFERRIPGQSLTNDPENPKAFEKPPQYTNRTEVLENYFEMLTEEETYLSIMDSLEEGVTVMEIVQVLIFQGFQDGLFNPDMMLMVAEPLAYMIAALAERADVDFVIMDDDDEDEEEDEEDLPVLNKKLKTIEKPQMDDDFPVELANKLDKVEPPKQRSLLGEK
jgi:hypothetical protein|tara:strand:- start:3482 stop:4018 length:537 start_codon:yes stop_codon:yes gene_type:complete